MVPVLFLVPWLALLYDACVRLLSLPIGDKKNKTEKKGFRTLKLKLKLNVNIVVVVVVVIPWEQKMENKFAFAIERGWPESYLNKLVKRSHNTWNMQSESFISA